MKKARRFLPTASVFVAALILILCPVFRVKNLFVKTSPPVETILSYPAEGSIKTPFAYKNIKRSADQTFVDPLGGLRFLFPATRGDSVVLSVSAYADEGATLALTVTPHPGGLPILLTRQGFMRDQMFGLTDLLPPETSFEVALLSTGSAGRLVVDRIAVSRIPEASQPPLLHRIVIFLLVLFFIVATALDWSRSAVPMIVGYGVCLGAMVAGHMRAIKPLATDGFWLTLLVGILLLRQWRCHKFGAKTMKGEAFAGVFAVAFLLRWSRFLSVFGQDLTEDPVGYRRYVSQLQWSSPFAHDYREPFYIWMQWIATYVFGPNVYQFRLLTVFLSVGTVYLTYRLVRKLSGRYRVSLAASFLLACNFFAVRSAPRGERNELFNFLLIAFCLAWVHFKKISWRSEAILGALAGVLSLTWLWGAFGVLLLYAGRIIRYRVQVRHWAIALTVFAALVVPYLISNWMRFGDPLHALNLFASYFKMIERTGLTGSSSDSTTWIQYVLSGASLPHWIAKLFLGYWNLFFNPFHLMHKYLITLWHLVPFSFVLFPFYLIGVASEAKRRNYAVFAMTLAFVNVSPCFIDDMISPRYLGFLSSFLVYFTGLGMMRVTDRAEPLILKASESVRFKWRN